MNAESSGLGFFRVFCRPAWGGIGGMGASDGGATAGASIGTPGGGITPSAHAPLAQPPLAHAPFPHPPLPQQRSQTSSMMHFGTLIFLTSSVRIRIFLVRTQQPHGKPHFFLWQRQPPMCFSQ